MTLSGIHLSAALLFLSVQAKAAFHDSIPVEFRGSFAPTAADCRDPSRVEVVEVAADGIHYYEGDDYLLLGIEFSGVSTRSGTFVPLFNGRFTGRMETQILGEVNARMEMETPNLLIRYTLQENGEPSPSPVNVWVRCPQLATGKKARHLSNQ